MKRMAGVVGVALAAIIAVTLTADTSANGLQRMYVLDCGRVIGKDQSRWTPGINAGQPRELSNNCYLLQHERGTLLWETGVPDSVVGQKDGVTSPNGAVVWFREKTLASQLESLGVKPDDITYVAMSHTHGDHVGNGKAFAKSKLPKTGALILTGDLVHFQYMWDNKIVPSFNFNKEQSLASIERVAKLVTEHKAKLWIGHDKDITAKIDRAPKFYE